MCSDPCHQHSIYVSLKRHRTQKQILCTSGHGKDTMIRGRGLENFRIPFANYDLRTTKSIQNILTCAPQALESRVRSNNGRELSCTAGMVCIGFRGKGSFLSLSCENKECAVVMMCSANNLPLAVYSKDK